MLDLPDSPRLLIEADLKPAQGTRFQPTGFPDIGAGTYRLPDEQGTEMLLVESAQSVANRLEAVCWDEATQSLRAPLQGLSYVQVNHDGAPLTNTLLEAHRLNSVYVEKSDQFENIKQAIGYVDKKPFDRDKLVRALCRYDVCSLLHGVFLESIAGVLRLPRALSGFIEARDVRVVSTGGVKNDRVMAGKDEEAGATAKEGHGNVPFHRDEYTAGAITAYFSLDLDQIRSYRLGGAAEKLLYGLALWKIQTFLERGLRLRTACDLDVKELRVTRPAGIELPRRAAVEELLPGLIKEVQQAGLFADPPVTIANYSDSKGKKK